MRRRKCKITFVAHGATVHSEENIFSDKEKYPPLSELGEYEISKVCEYLQNRGVKSNKIYSSPAMRCSQSAELISHVFKTKFVTLPDLYERKCGEWNGLSLDSIFIKHPELKETPLDVVQFTPNGGEPLKDFNKRVNTIISKIVEEQIGNRIIIVTYPDVIQAAVANALELDEKNEAKVLIKTGSLTQISYFSNWASVIYSGYIPL